MALSHRLRRFRSLLKALNIQIPKGNGFHAFRHANAVLMDRLSVPMKVRQQRLGHGDATVTLGFYTHAVGKDSLRAASELGGIVWRNATLGVLAGKWDCTLLLDACEHWLALRLLLRKLDLLLDLSSKFKWMRHILERLRATACSANHDGSITEHPP
jgi:hypothetical protein